jgi:hypothetical protein
MMMPEEIRGENDYIGNEDVNINIKNRALSNQHKQPE